MEGKKSEGCLVTSEGNHNKLSQRNFKNENLKMLSNMLDNGTVESLLRIPSHSSDSACSMLELDDPMFARSKSAPICKGDKCRAARPGIPLVRSMCSSSEDAPFCRGARSCPDRTVQLVERTPTRMVSTKRAHNFLVGLQLHQESVRAMACRDSQNQAVWIPYTVSGFGWLLSGELWESLLQ